MNLAALLAEHDPDATAIADRDGVLSFGELDDRSSRAAGMLRADGLRPGDAVLVLVPMCAELYVVLLALARAGLVAVFLDPGAGADHVTRCCERMGPRALIGRPRAHLLRLAVGALRRIPLAYVVGGRLPATRCWERSRRFEPAPVHEVEDDHPALVTFTSGSTGAPKGAVRSHGFLLAQHAALARALDHRAGAVDLATLPIFALADLASGQTVLIPDADLRRPGAIDPRRILRQVERWRPRSLVASPALLERLVARCEETGTTLAGCERIFTGGGPVFPDLLERAQRCAPDGEAVAVYGSTEAEPIAEVAWSGLSAADLAAMRSGAGLLAGRPVAEIALRIVRDRWGEPLGAVDGATFAGWCLPPDAAGEIVVSGDHVLPGYLDGHGDEETKFRVGGRVWHRTGDRGRLDGEGRLWLLGRCSAAVHDRRGTLEPFAVEVAARAVDGVRRAALVPLGGGRVLAFEGGADPDALRRSLSWADLDAVHRVRRMPLDRRHNAKIDEPALRRLLERQP